MPPVAGESTNKDIPGVNGSNDVGIGTRGLSKTGSGVIGGSESGVAVWGHSDSSSGVGGMSDTGIGVHGVSEKGPAGVRGDCAGGVGVSANSVTGRAVEGNCPQGTGVVGTSQSGVGVWGGSDSSSGVGGMSKTGHGVHGVSEAEHGVVGDSTHGVGIWGRSQNGEGIHAETSSPTVAALAALNNNPAGTGAAVWAKKVGTVGHAGFFDGNVQVTGTLIVDNDVMLTKADCAEDFDVADAAAAEAGTVMVLNGAGQLSPCESAYDKRVVGVVSGAGSYRPAIVLDRAHTDQRTDRQPIALVGKTYCRVDATYAAIHIGDLLTTSPTHGHAMKAGDPGRAFGAVIGKALQSLTDGPGLIAILVALQ